MDIPGQKGEFLPHVWGEGAIFAFSGVDGPTCTAAGFTTTFDHEPYNFLVHTPLRARLRLRAVDPGQVTIATNDVLAVSTAGGDLLFTFSAWHTLCGRLPAGITPALEAVDQAENALPGASLLSAAPGQSGFLALAQSGRRFAVAYGESTAEARARAEAGLACNLEEILAQRLAFIDRLPVLPDAAETRFLRKCASVMKVNTLAPEVAIRQRWSTPDRVPHQHMWLWDSVFHSIGMNWIDADLSWEFLQAMLEHVQPDGCMPITVEVDGASSPMTQPPILAWGVWENYQVSGDKTRLRQALPALEAYLEWNLSHRDQNRNGLLEWLIEEDERCRSGESGMDNSPRFDGALTLDAVDFSTFQACDMDYLAKICRVLGLDARSAIWQGRAQKTSRAVHALLWDKQVQFYTDGDMGGHLTHVRAVSSFCRCCWRISRLSMPPPWLGHWLIRAHSDRLFRSPACLWITRSGRRICGGGRPGSISITWFARLCASAVIAAKPDGWRRLPWQWCAGNTSASGWCLSFLTPPDALLPLSASGKAPPGHRTISGESSIQSAITIGRRRCA